MTSDCVENFDVAHVLQAPVESNHDIFDQVIALSSVEGSQKGTNNYLKNSVRRRLGQKSDIDGFMANKIETKAYPRHHW